MTKTVCKLVPESSTYVAWGNLDSQLVINDWHTVYWPPRPDQCDFVAYDYGDTNFLHAWTVNNHYAYFEDYHEAVQFALLFGGGVALGSDT